MIKYAHNMLAVSLLSVLTLAVVGVITCSTQQAAGQGISFDFPESDVNYAVHLAPVGGYENLDFGLVGSGMHSEIPLHSDDVAILAISGVRYLDVYVALDPDPFLYLDDTPTSEDNKRLGLTLHGAFANQGEGNFGPGYRQPFNGTTVLFPLFRSMTGPPGPPPVPPHSGYVPPRTTAYIFLYGNIEIPSTINAGYYYGHVQVTVEYDL